jgi:hypothetical protein
VWSVVGGNHSATVSGTAPVLATIFFVLQNHSGSSDSFAFQLEQYVGGTWTSLWSTGQGVYGPSGKAMLFTAQYYFSSLPVGNLILRCRIKPTDNRFLMTTAIYTTVEMKR